METEKNMNVLVLGSSGCGKTTLIKAISGVDIVTKGSTQEINVYSSNNWPLTFIDTKGYEYSTIEQWKSIYQVKKYVKKQINSLNESGIDAVWYCIDGTVRRTFKYNVDLMIKSIKKWKNIPVFVVLTKSYSKPDIDENIESVRELFKDIKEINLKDIIPVVALEYKIDDEHTVEVSGIEELCLKTLECIDEAKEISKDNKERMILNQKRFTAHGIVSASTISAAVVGVAPIPAVISDSTILIPIEVGMTKSIFKIYKVKYSEGLVDKIVGSVIITMIAKQIVQAIPIVGSVANGVVAGGVVLTLGEGIVAVCEEIRKGNIDPEKIDEVTAKIEEYMKNSAIIGILTTYFEKNKDGLKNKKANEILAEIINMTKNDKSKK